METNKFIYRIPFQMDNQYLIDGKNILGFKTKDIQYNLIGHIEYGRYIVPLLIEIDHGNDFRNEYVNISAKGDSFIDSCVVVGYKLYDELKKHERYLEAILYHEIAHIFDWGLASGDASFFDEYMADRFAVAHIGKLYKEACICEWDFIRKQKILIYDSNYRLEYISRFRKICDDTLRINYDVSETIEYLSSRTSNIYFEFTSDKIIKYYEEEVGPILKHIGYAYYKQFKVPLLLNEYTVVRKDDNGNEYDDSSGILNISAVQLEGSEKDYGAIVIGEKFFNIANDIDDFILRALVYHEIFHLIGNNEFFGAEFLADRFSVQHIGYEKYCKARAIINQIIKVYKETFPEDRVDLITDDANIRYSLAEHYDILQDDTLRIELFEEKN